MARSTRHLYLDSKSPSSWEVITWQGKALVSQVFYLCRRRLKPAATFFLLKMGRYCKFLTGHYCLSPGLLLSNGAVLEFIIVDQLGNKMLKKGWHNNTS